MRGENKAAENRVVVYQDIFGMKFKVFISSYIHTNRPCPIVSSGLVNSCPLDKMAAISNTTFSDAFS